MDISKNIIVNDTVSTCENFMGDEPRVPKSQKKKETETPNVKFGMKKKIKIIKPKHTKSTPNTSNVAKSIEEDMETFDELVSQPRTYINMEQVCLDGERDKLVRDVRLQKVSGFTPQDIQNISIQMNETKLEIHENQKEFGDKIQHAFLDKKVFSIMAIAPTQSGKTGSMVSLCLSMCKHNSIQQNPEKIFVITGFSSKDWMTQTTSRFPDILEGNIYHRNTLKQFVQKIQNMGDDARDLLILVDEVQYASLPFQTLYHVFMECGFLDMTEIYKRNIKFVFVSATPDGIMVDLQQWKIGTRTIFMNPGETYISTDVLFQNKQIKQYGELYDVTAIGTYKNIMNVYNDIESKWKTSFKYHIIRTQRSEKHFQTMKNFKDVLGFRIQRQMTEFQKQDFLFVSEANIKMLKLLKIEPKKHVFIFIKDKLRCAQTICKDYIGVMYERYTKIINDSAVIQGLLGRMTGYHKNTEAIVYTNLKSVEKYNNLVQVWMNNQEQSDGEHDELPWRSNTTKAKAPYTKHTFLSTQPQEKLLDDEYIDFGLIDECLQENRNNI